MLKLQKLTVSIGKKKILNSLDYTFETGKIYAIMGPNGSGKSTLANAVMGNPVYDVKKGSKILFEGENIAELEPHERSQKGIFMSFQSPVALSGVTAYQLLRYALHGSQDPLTIRQKVQKFAKELGISEDLLSRSLNDGFSGEMCIRDRNSLERRHFSEKSMAMKLISIILVQMKVRLRKHTPKNSVEVHM